MLRDIVLHQTEKLRHCALQGSVKHCKNQSQRRFDPLPAILAIFAYVSEEFIRVLFHISNEL